MKHHLSVMSRALSPAAFVGLMLWLSTTDLRAAEISGSDLTGTVKNAEGDPVSGATVFIYTAAPKEGVAVLCPSCYADCRKRTTTDARGHFTIESLDPALLFRVLVAAGDYQPKFVDKVDPSAKVLSIKLKLASLGDTPDARVTGRVVTPEGKPLSG